MLRYLSRVFKNSQTHIKPRSSDSSLCATGFMVKPVVMDAKLYRVPPEVRGMTSLDKQAFTQSVSVPALCVSTRVLNKVIKSLRKSTIQRPGIARVVNAGSEDERLILLDPRRVTSTDSFSAAEVEALRSFDVPMELRFHQLTLTYENLKSEEVLEAILPPGQDVSSGFSRVGHIIHMNLRDHQLPYKTVIGQVMMDKNPGVTCVVNKTNVIDTTYRNFKMEVLAGEEDMLAKVKENGVTYEFDFSQVYWNPRLSTEHQRVVQLVKRGDTVFDVFAGVGPFAIPAARAGAEVYANDLNPQSFRWLQHNSRVNKVSGRVRCFNLDGREFVRGPLCQQLPALLPSNANVHVVMNLPALALDFLDAFKGLLPQQDPEYNKLPTVHCYGFSKDQNPEEDVVRRASQSLGFPLDGRCSVHFVRNVAPNKDMMCVSFTLPKEVLFSLDQDESEPAPKKQKCDEATA
ncbi:tRNA (guanine(37)-N(1))-methyltransferase isoform 1-T1 [Synchiropus picturatus]